MTSLEQRTEALLARHRANSSLPTRQEIDDLYTDGCAEVLEIEIHYRRVERGLERAERDALLDPGAGQRIASLSVEREELRRRRSELRAKLRQLRAAVDWKRGEGAPDLAGRWPVGHAPSYRRSD